MKTIRKTISKNKKVINPISSKLRFSVYYLSPIGYFPSSKSDYTIPTIPHIDVRARFNAYPAWILLFERED